MVFRDGRLEAPQGGGRVSKKNSTSRKLVPVKSASLAVSADLLGDIRKLIEQARDATALAVNSALVLLYWSIGDRIRRDILKEKRADYGARILGTLSQELSSHYGKGYTYDNLTRMVRLAEVFADREIVGALSRQLGWSHFLLLLPIKDELKRQFYAEMCRVERWSVRTLRQKIGGMLFERTALSKKPEKLAKKELAKLRTTDQLSPDLVFRDPYFLDFLGLKDTYAEADLEAAILRDIESFLIELGTGFTFVARQKRMVIDGDDFRLDLLFYHRKLRRLVALDLKLGKFEAADKGQMELYLRWLDKHEREPSEKAPLGLILCESAGEEQVELLQLGESGIRVATYLTELPPKPLLEQKLRTAAELARQRLKEVEE
jgi:predicted nuclease of restriction endonuclease-like (RecB) superfamily